MDDEFEPTQEDADRDYWIEDDNAEHELRFDDDYLFVEDWVSQIDLFGRNNILCDGIISNDIEKDSFIILESNFEYTNNSYVVHDNYDNLFNFKWVLNIGSSVGSGPKIFDYYGEAKPGWSLSYGLFGVDYLPGGDPEIMPNIGLSWHQLASISYGFAGTESGITSSVSFRILAFEISGSLNIDSKLIIQKIQSDYRAYRVP